MADTVRLGSGSSAEGSTTFVTLLWANCGKMRDWRRRKTPVSNVSRHTTKRRAELMSRAKPARSNITNVSSSHDS